MLPIRQPSVSMASRAHRRNARGNWHSALAPTRHPGRAASCTRSTSAFHATNQMPHMAQTELLHTVWQPSTGGGGEVLYAKRACVGAGGGVTPGGGRGSTGVEGGGEAACNNMTRSKPPQPPSCLSQRPPSALAPACAPPSSHNLPPLASPRIPWNGGPRRIQPTRQHPMQRSSHHHPHTCPWPGPVPPLSRVRTTMAQATRGDAHGRH